MQGEKCRAVGGARRSRPAARRKSPIAESAPARNFFRDAFSRRLICPVPMRVRVCATSQQWYRRPVLALQPDSMQMQGPPRCGNIGRSVGILPSSRGRPMRSPAAGEEAARARDPAQKDASGKKSQGAGRLGGGVPMPACWQAPSPLPMSFPSERAEKNFFLKFFAFLGQEKSLSFLSVNTSSGTRSGAKRCIGKKNHGARADSAAGSRCPPAGKRRRLSRCHFHRSGPKIFFF